MYIEIHFLKIAKLHIKLQPRQNEAMMNMFQTKEQDKIPEEELSKVETGSLPRKTTDQRIWENSCTVFNKELENIKNNQTEMKNTITEMKNTLKGIKRRLNDTEKWVRQ